MRMNHASIMALVGSLTLLSAQGNPGTSVGAPGPDPSPSCPWSVAPQQTTGPERRAAQLWLVPTATLTASSIPGTAAGAFIGFVALPSLP
jgi:hypothetical protein